MTTLTEQELLAAIQSGKPDAQEQVFDALTMALLTPRVLAEIETQWGINAAEVKKRLRHRDQIRLKQQRAITELGEWPKTVKRFVELWITKNSLTMGFNGVWNQAFNPPQGAFCNLTPEQIQYLSVSLKAQTQNWHLKRVLDNMELDSDEWQCGYARNKIDAALSEWMEARKQECVSEVVETIRHTTGKREHKAENWKTVLDQFEGDDELNQAILEHFMWQVKRKMLGEPVKHHLMPVLLGAQGIGKSQFITMMLKPLESLTLNVDFQSAMDDRWLDVWNFYVLVLDEMGGMSKTDIDTIKQRITMETFSGRMMRSNSGMTIRNFATLIGSSNRSLDELVRDSTGMRRFAPLQMKATARQGWSALRGVDWKSLWQSVNELDEEPPIMRQWTKLQAVQESGREQSPVERWLETWTQPTGKRFTAGELWLEFNEWRHRYEPAWKESQQLFLKTLATEIQNNPDCKLMKISPKGRMVYVVR